MKVGPFPIELVGLTTKFPPEIEIVKLQESVRKEYYSSYGRRVRVAVIDARIRNNSHEDAKFTLEMEQRDGDLVTGSAFLDISIPPNGMVDRHLIFGGLTRHQIGIWYIMRCKINHNLYSIEPILLKTVNQDIKLPPCFVTTAAYGDPHHPMVETFRSFREDILVNRKAGRSFIGWYNNNGPKLAAKIENRPALRAAARVVLTPLALTIKATRATAKRITGLKNQIMPK